SPEIALRTIQTGGEHNLGFARVDTGRLHRKGMPEVIYCPGKTPEQVIQIMAAIKDAGQDVLATRASKELYEAVVKVHKGANYHDLARAITIKVTPQAKPIGLVAVVSAGTADLPVAEEAALTAEWMGAKVERVYDVGVAGLHRLINHVDLLRSARAVIVAAGMEGALPSVVGGLIDRPIVAVPTSVGYGMNLGGIAPLLAMLNTCAPGVMVVNIDNGFGAGVSAALINRLGDKA
ncbi:MAG TPA: nickel pincer cofactor biosynthesis protein LarB, partial [Kiritimatiellia bacterium]